MSYVLVASVVVYFAATLLLFVFGGNLMMLAFTMVRRGKIVPPAAPGMLAADDLPVVTVQLPIFNERYVAARIIDSVCAVDYPSERLEVQVLDDSDDDTREIVAAAVERHRSEGVDIVHLHRDDRSGYKAGALAAGLAVARGELIAIFDADFICPPEFLLETVGHFDDPLLGFVQTRWGHANRESSWMTRLEALAIDGHFAVEQGARGVRRYWFNFNGTAGVWRAAAIGDAGGWTADTLTEDLDLSYRAHLAGWHGHYRPDIEVPGELPVQLAGFRRQQHRWARGSMECAAKLLPQVWASNASKATKFQATAHLLAYGVHLLLAVLALLYPAVVLAGTRYSGVTTLYGAGFLFALASFAPAIFFLAGQHVLGRSWRSAVPRVVLVTLLGSGLMLNTVRAFVQIFTRPNPEFERTAKFGLDGGRPDAGVAKLRRYQLDLDRIVFGELVLGLYCVGAAALAWRERNAGVFVYAAVFAAGLLGIAAVSIVQAIGVRRSRPDRDAVMAAEQRTLEPASG